MSKVAELTTAVAVEISNIIPEAQRLPAHAVVVGDTVFDCFGRPHRITDLKTTSQRGETPLLWIRRDDNPARWEPWVFIDEEVTIRPSLEARA